MGAPIKNYPAKGEFPTPYDEVLGCYDWVIDPLNEEKVIRPVRYADVTFYSIEDGWFNPHVEGCDGVDAPDWWIPMPIDAPI